MKRIDLNAGRYAGRLHRWSHRAWRLLKTVYGELWRTRAFTIAAALAFYFLTSMIPLLVVFSSLLQFLPVPDVFQQLLDVMARLVPPDSLTFVERIVSDILTPDRGKLLSFGLLGYLWAATGGFSALIESLDIAYDVQVSRPWWRGRLRALLLTFTSGGLVSLSVVLLISGPYLGHFLSQVFPPFHVIEHLWPLLRLTLIGVTFVTSVEFVYYLGPNCRHSFLSTLPGAVVAIAIWFLGSAGLNYYLTHLSNYNATYGSMGVIIGLMLWFYITALAMLIGAELNAELSKLHPASVICDLPQKAGKPLGTMPAPAAAKPRT